MFFTLALKLRFALCLIVIVPALVLTILVLNYSVNVPVWDQWWVTQTIIKAMSGKLTFNDLLAQHNESRKFFPRLIDIALAYLTKYDVRAEMLVSVFMTCVTSLNLTWLSYLTVSRRLTVVCALTFLTNLLLFSPIQYEAWLNGLSNVVYISLACITSSLVIATTNFISPVIKLVLCAALATISTFSFANGILAWIVVFPVLYVFESRLKWAFKLRLALGWVVAAALNLSVYFYHYTKPSYHPSLLTALGQPGQAIVYFLAFLGNPLAWGTALQAPHQAVIVGAVLLVLYCLFCVYWLKSYQESYLWQRGIVWVCLGVYAFASAFIATMGRVGFSSEQALASRYTTFAIYGFVSVINAVAIALGDKRARCLNYHSFIKQVTTVLTTVLVLLHSFTFIYALTQMQQMRQDRLFAKACLLFINVVPDAECIEHKLYWGIYNNSINFGGIGHLRAVANAADRLGLMHPPLLTTSYFRDSATNNTTNGFFELIPQDNNQYLAQGWAILPDLNRSADAVILTYDTQAGAKAFKVLPVGGYRHDVQQFLGNTAYLYSGWSGTFTSASILPKNAKIEAWAFDVEAAKVYKLKELH